MYNAGKITVGLVVFLALITFPIWYNLATGKAGYSPELEKAAKGETCVRDSAYMVAYHMDLLDTWRDQVVRDGQRYEQLASGRTVERSLSNTCLDCHVNKDAFCDRCHHFVGVDPYCWDCHIVPEEHRR